jgi:photosystem II stability/assembly factor-like uncharacterized protein
MIKSNLLLTFSVFILVLVSGCASNKDVEYREPEPMDHWMMQRSHPEEGFDKEAYLHGIEQVNLLKKEKGGPDLNLTWELEGPLNIGGRINVVTPLFQGSDTLFAGTANGGVFRTFDGGLNWTSIFDDFTFLSIGAITVDPNNNQRIFVGTGDRNFGGGSYIGDGLYVSEDLGNNWINTGLSQVGIISSVIVDDQNSDNLLVGALGSGFEKNTERGVYRSTDGGSTWVNTLFVSDSSGVCEMVADPTNSSVIYACFFNRVNLATRSVARGLDSKIYKSIDGGVSWNQLTNGLPSTEHSRVGIAVSASNPNRLYAVYVGDTYNVSEIYRSDDAGANWTGINANSGNNGLDQSALGGFGWYFGRIYVNPLNENHIILPGVDQYESYDAGVNWALNVPIWWTYEVHADKHALIFQDANTIIIGTDGGMYKTEDLGASWTPLGELPITQFYRVEANTHTAGRYAGGAQDNGSTSGNQNGDWSRDFGGDGFQTTHVDPTDNQVIYQTQRGNFHWASNVFGVETMSVSDFDANEITNWDTPYLLNDGQSLVAGTNRLLIMDTPPFDTWQDISGDLTLSGTGAVQAGRYHTITELSNNPDDDNEIMIGTSDGMVWRGNIFSGMNNWVDISGSLPEKYVTSVNFSKRVANKLYVTMSGYYSGFVSALVFKSDDNGATWTDISSNMPAIGINDMITYERDNNEFLFVATDAGVFVSEDDGASWDLMGSGLPTVTVSALDIDETSQRLIAGTFGRSMWSYDVSWVLGTNELSEDEKPMVYPNPMSDYFESDGNYDEVILLTVDGRLVKNFGPVKEGDAIDVSSFDRGHYLLKLNNRLVKVVLN